MSNFAVHDSSTRTLLYYYLTLPVLLLSGRGFPIDFAIVSPY